MLSEMAAPDLERDQEPDQARRTAPDLDHAPGLNQQPDPARRTTPDQGRAGRMDPRRTLPDWTAPDRGQQPDPLGLLRRTQEPDPPGLHPPGQQPDPDRRPMPGAIAPAIENDFANCPARTRPGPAAGPDQPRRKGFYAPGLSPDSLDIYAPYPRQPAGPGQDWTDGPGPDRPAAPDQQNAPAQDSTHTRTGANQTAPACVGTPWAPLVACGSVSAGFF